MMTRTITLFALATIGCAPAMAEPKTPDRPEPRRPEPRPLPPECRAEGTPLFQVDQYDLGKVVASTKLFATGAWQSTGTMTANGCDRGEVETVKRLLASAPWTISHPIHCEMATRSWTAYVSNGKTLFTERACNPDQLDDKSAKVLKELAEEIAKLTAPMHGGNPPGCKAGGDVALEINHGAFAAAAKVETSLFKLFDSGAWTFQATNADGSAGASKSGCLDAADKARIDDDLKAPFTVIVPKVKCMARSMTFVKYTVHGKEVFTRQVCGNGIDDVSAKKIEDIEAIVGKLES